MSTTYIWGSSLFPGGAGTVSGLNSLGAYATYSALTTANPASPTLTDNIAYVSSSTGVYLINRKNKGWYICDGVSWIPWEYDSLAADALAQHLIDSSHVPPHIIEDEGTPLTQRSSINFTGTGIAVTDSGGKTVVTVNSGSVSDADASTKGVLKLTNDLGGTADLPTVPGIETNAVISRFRRGYNDTGSTIAVYKFVCLSGGFFSNYPKIQINDFSSPCIGVLTSSLATSTGAKVQYYGVLQFGPGIVDTTSIPLNTPVYVDSSGNLTLSYTRIIAGHTLSQETSPYILLNVRYIPELYLEFTFTSITSQTFNHNFNRYPNVTIMQGTTDITSGVSIDYPDKNSVSITSNIAITGKIICSCD